jgi:hypothetical protein
VKVTIGIVVASGIILIIGTAIAQGRPTGPTRGIRSFYPSETAPAAVDQTVSRLAVQAAPFAVTLLPGSALSRLLAAELSTSPSDIAQVEVAREKSALARLCPRFHRPARRRPSPCLTNEVSDQIVIPRWPGAQPAWARDFSTKDFLCRA